MAAVEMLGQRTPVSPSHVVHDLIIKSKQETVHHQCCVMFFALLNGFTVSVGSLKDDLSPSWFYFLTYQLVWSMSQGKDRQLRIHSRHLVLV